MQLSNTAYHVTRTRLSVTRNMILILISWTGTTAISFQWHYLTM